MAAQVEVQTGEVGRTVAGGRLHLSPLTDSSNTGLMDIPLINQAHLITPEPSKPVPGPKPRLTPKPFAVEKNPTIKPILAPKPQTKPRPESTRIVGYKPVLPSSSKPDHPVAGGKPRPVSTNPNRPVPTSIRTSPKINAGQTTKPVVQPFKPAPALEQFHPSKPIPPVPAARLKPGPSSLAYSKSLKTHSPSEWSGTTKIEGKDQMPWCKGGGSMTRARSMGFLTLMGKEEDIKDSFKPEEVVPLRPQPRGSRPRPVSAIFLSSPTKTEAPVPAPHRAGRRPLSADLTAKFESIGLSLHRKSPKVDTKENTPQENAAPQIPDRHFNSSPPATDVAKCVVCDQQSKTSTQEISVKETDGDKRGVSIKSRISLLLDSSSSPGTGPSGQTSDLQSPVTSVPETETPVGVKKLIKQLTEDATPNQSPTMKPALKPRPLPLDLTKKFSSERSPDLGSFSLSEATEHHAISKDPQRRVEDTSDQRTLANLQEPLQKASVTEGPEAGRTSIVLSSPSSREVHTVRASLFENVVERHSVLMVDDGKPVNKTVDSLSSPSPKTGNHEDDGTLVTATYKEPLSPSSPLRVLHALDTVHAVEESRALSETVPSAQWEDKAMTLRSRRSEGNRPAAERTVSAQQSALMPEQQPRYLRVGALPKWTTTGLDQDVGMEKGMLTQSPREEVALDKDRDEQREAEPEEVAAAPKRLKMLQAEELTKPKATYFALTGQMQVAGSLVDGGAVPGDTAGSFSDFSMRSGQGSSQGKILLCRRNPSLDQALQTPPQYQVKDLKISDHVSHREIRSALDGHIAEEMMELEKKREPKKEAKKDESEKKELEREKQRQLEVEKQALLEFVRRKESEMQRECERHRQKAFEREKQELEEKQRALEKQKQRELEAQKLLELEREKQRELEREKQRQLENEKIQELERQWEQERWREEERRREEERQREEDRQRELENERLREYQRQRDEERRREEERQRELEREKLCEHERQREEERRREEQRQREEERQRELDKERQLLEIQKHKQRMEELAKMKDLERKRLLEVQKQNQRERERQQLLELEKQRHREKMEREEAEKIRRVAIEQEMLRRKELEKERERQREMEKERLKEMERERQTELERERQKQLDVERQELEKQRLRRRELENERLQKEELDVIKEMEQKQIWELEMQKHNEGDRQHILEAEEIRLSVKLEKEEAEKMRQIVRQQEAERQRLKEKQRKEEQDRVRLDSSALRPKVVDLDAVVRNDPCSKPSSQRSDPAARWKEPSPRAEESYKPAILDIDSFTSQAQTLPSKDLLHVSSMQGVDPSFGARLRPPPERDGSWKAPPQTSASVSSPVWTQSPQDPWELWPAETSEPRKHANELSPEQLLFRERRDRRHWSGGRDEPHQRTPLAVPDARGGGGSSSPAEKQIWFLKDPQPQDYSGAVRSQRRSQGSQELNRMRSRSVSRRSAPSSSALERSLSRVRSRSAHREQDSPSWVQQKQSVSGEDEGRDSVTPACETDSQYGTWETGLRTDDSLTPASPNSESSPSSRKPTPSHTPEEHSDGDVLDVLHPSPSPENELLSFPDTPTTLLDNSALRSRAQLGKKRAPRTRPSRAARQSAVQAEGGASEDWLYRDSTEEKVERKNDDSDSEDQARGGDGGSTAAAQTQRVALFPRMDPLALKAQLKKRGDSDNQAAGPSPSQLSCSPKSPFLPRAARVLPPHAGKENDEEDSPQWLRELKTKKRLSQYENES
ncbi:uncharacterized protein ACBR49_020270 [Aulostomus maculatus]